MVIVLHFYWPPIFSHKFLVAIGTISLYIFTMSIGRKNGEPEPQRARENTTPINGPENVSRSASSRFGRRNKGSIDISQFPDTVQSYLQTSEALGKRRTAISQELARMEEILRTSPIPVDLEELKTSIEMPDGTTKEMGFAELSNMKNMLDTTALGRLRVMRNMDERLGDIASVALGLGIEDRKPMAKGKNTQELRKDQKRLWKGFEGKSFGGDHDLDEPASPPPFPFPFPFPDDFE